MDKDIYKKAFELIKNSKHLTAFTGAGISVESDIPPFRGENGLWSRYDPVILELDYFFKNPEKSWKVIKEIFYDYFGEAKPNDAHIILAKLEQQGILKTIITQNIDNLHFIAGNKNVFEFHGNSRNLVCLKCGEIYPAKEEIFNSLPPRCMQCGGILKPDFIFFGEGIDENIYSKSIKETQIADLFLLIGTSGVIYPASLLPHLAKENGAKIIEINPQPSEYTNSITDLFIQEKASTALKNIYKYFS